MLLEILSANYVEIRHTATVDIPQGTLTTFNDVLAFPLADVLDTKEGMFISNAEKVRGDKAAVAIDEGEPIYFDSGADNLTNVSGGNKLVGYNFRAVEMADSKIIFKFNGYSAFLKL